MLEHHSNNSYRQGGSFSKSVLKIATTAGYKNVALSLAIFAADGMVESRVAAIQRTFSEGRDMLKNWSDFTRIMFPGRHDLLDKLTDPMKMTLARISEHGWLRTTRLKTPEVVTQSNRSRGEGERNYGG